MGRRILLVLLSAVLVLSLAGCGFPEKSAGKEEELARLRELLDQVAENIKEGQPPITAELAVDFLSWAGTTQLTKEETAQQLSDWLADQSPSIRLAAEERLNEMLDSLTGILKDGAEKAKEWDFKSVLQEILSSGGIE